MAETDSMEEYLAEHRKVWISKLLDLVPDLPQKIAEASYDDAHYAGRAGGRIEALRTFVDCDGDVDAAICALQVVGQAEHVIVDLLQQGGPE